MVSFMNAKFSTLHQRWLPTDHLIMIPFESVQGIEPVAPKSKDVNLKVWQVEASGIQYFTFTDLCDMKEVIELGIARPLSM